MNEAVASSLTVGIGKVFSLFYKVPSKVVRKLLSTITNVAISLKTQSIGKSAVKIWDKNKNGKLDWQTRVKSNIYGNIALSEWRVG
ncbi:MAG: hypothetical protein SOW41_00180 [Anaerococcus sp.]|nr:hypothetical protein [Peptoniphilaceae bacterium]MDY3054456.1 hypothetical protein [Anaerococcus sp.]